MAALAASTGLSILAQPPHEYAWLAYFSLAPWIHRVRTPLVGAVSGLVLGTAVGLGVGAWVPAALESAGFTQHSAAWIWLATCAGVRGIPLALLGVVVGLFAHRPLGQRSIACAGTVFLVEWGASATPAGAPWGLLGHSQWSALAIAQLAAVGGVPLVSALLVSSNVVAAHLARRGLAGSDRRAAMSCVAAIMAVYLGGRLVCVRAADSRSEGPALDVVGIQLVTPRGEKWNPQLQTGHLETAFHEVRAAIAGRATRPDLVVLPETVVTESLEDHPAVRGALSRFAREIETPLLLGIVRRALTDPTRHYRNGVVMVEPGGSLVDGPDKVAGVPFVEAEPAGAWRLLSRLVGGRRTPRIEPGNAPHLRAAGTEIAVVTCYEILFPGLVAGRMTRAGVPIVYLADDGWADGAAMAQQALAAASFRAIENRSALLRVAGGGISAWIGPDGRRLEELPYRDHGHVDAQLRAVHPHRAVDAAILLGALLGGSVLGAWISTLQLRRPLMAIVRALVLLSTLLWMTVPEAAASQAVTTLRLDGLSYRSLGSERTLAIPPGSTAFAPGPSC